MTSYWDSWGQVHRQVFDGDKRIPVELFKRATEELLKSLHLYDHEHGGHVLDTWCEQNKSLSNLMSWMVCSTKTRGAGAETGHHWNGDKCLYCKAPKHLFAEADSN